MATIRSSGPFRAMEVNKPTGSRALSSLTNESRKKVTWKREAGGNNISNDIAHQKPSSKAAEKGFRVRCEAC
jgi:hypothetical protein